MPNVGVGPPNNNQQPPLPPQGVSPPGSAVIPPLPPQPSAPQPPQPQLQAEVKSDTSAKISQNNQKSAVNQNPPIMGTAGVNSAPNAQPAVGPRNGSSGSAVTGPPPNTAAAAAVTNAAAAGGFANNTNKSSLGSASTTQSDTAVASVPKRPRKSSGAAQAVTGVAMPFPMQTKNASPLENVSLNFFLRSVFRVSTYLRTYVIIEIFFRIFNTLIFLKAFSIDRK